MLGQLAALLRKDFLTASRRWHELASIALVSVVAGVAVAYLISGPRAAVVEEADAAAVIAAGQVVVYLIVAVSAGYLAVLREAEKGTLEGLRASPAQPEAVFVSKLVYIYVVLLALSLTYAASAAFFSGAPGTLTPGYAAAVAATGLYFAVASALTSFMIVYSESRSLLSVVVLSGLVVPYLQEADGVLAEAAQTGTAPEEVVAALGAALAFAVLAVLLSRPLSEI